MDIWARWNKQTRKCHYDLCFALHGLARGPIERGDPVIIGRSKKLTAAGMRTFNYAWHPDCWLAQAMDHLTSIPESERVSPRGRRPVAANLEVRKRRVSLLQKRASLNHRQVKAALAGDAVRVLALEAEKQSLIPLILETGPLPKRWRVE